MSEIDFPYIPGLLTFRKLPLLEEAWKNSRNFPDILICDGQGRGHPKRVGPTSHIGLVFNIPTVGYTKIRLIGTHTEPSGCQVNLYDGKELIGRVLRTRKSDKPVYIHWFPGSASTSPFNSS